jgi:hypothetical protein
MPGDSDAGGTPELRHKMIKSSDFLTVRLGPFQYLFFLIADDYWLASGVGSRVAGVLDEAFAKDLGPHAAMVRSFFEDRRKNHRLILDKPWPDDVRREIDNTQRAQILVITRDFDSFDPRIDGFALLELPNDEKEGLALLREVGRTVASGEDLFDVARKRQSKLRKVWQRAVDALKLEPGAFGFAVDLKRLFGKQ